MMKIRLLAGFALLLTLTGSAPAAPTDAPGVDTPPVPVPRLSSRAALENHRLVGEVLVNDEVFLQVLAGIGRLSAVRRAEVIAERLAGLAGRGLLRADEVRTEQLEGGLVLMVGKTPVAALDRTVALGPAFERLTGLPRVNHSVFIYGRDDERLVEDLRAALGTEVDAVQARMATGLSRYPLVILGPEVPNAARLLADYAGPVVAMGPNGLKYLRSRDPAWNSAGGLVLLDVRAPDRTRLRLYNGAVYAEMVAPGERTVLARSGEAMVAGGSGDLWYWGYESTDKQLTDQGRAVFRELVERARLGGEKK